MSKVRKMMMLIRDYGFCKAMNLAFNRLLNNRFVQRKKIVRMIKKSFSEDVLNGESKNKLNNGPLISILMPVYNTDIDMLKCVLDSVEAQCYSRFELCICDGSDEEHENVSRLCEQYAKTHSFVRYEKLEVNLGISGNTNACACLAKGEYLALLDNDDILHPHALYKMALAAVDGADFIYTDEATFRGSIFNVVSTNFKPDYAPDTLRANNYICHFTGFKTALFNSVGGFRKEFDGSQDHDLFLRLTDRAQKIVHIPEILYFWRVHEGSVSKDIYSKEYAIEAGKRAVAGFLHEKGQDAEVVSTDVFPTIYRIKYAIKGNPLVSIIILNKNHEKDLRRCVESIGTSTYDNYEIIIVENNSDEQTIFDYYEELKQNSHVKITVAQGEFNYSAYNNLGVDKAQGEYIILLNNDTQVIEPHWIEEMLMFAQRQDVGAVGARLFYPDNTLQHCFVITGIGEDAVAIHAGLGLPADNYGYLDRIAFNQDVNAVTAACLMVSREKYQKSGKFDEKLKIAYNDVDFCLKLREMGLVNVYTPFATLYHYESSSRGSDWNKANRDRQLCEAEYLKQKWGRDIKDPYYNPNFSEQKAYMLR